MPVYDFKCGSCEKIEEGWATYETLEAPRPCSCGGVLRYFPSFGRSADAQRFDPVVIHKDAQGNIRFPGSSNAPVPAGFERIELTNVYQVRKFEKEVNERDSAQASSFNHAQQVFREGQLAENRRAIEAIKAGGAWQGLDENGKVITLHGMSERGRRFYDAMREASERKNSQHKSVDPAFFVEAFSQNASNREIGRDYRNKQDGWERRNK